MNKTTGKGLAFHRKRLLGLVAGVLSGAAQRAAAVTGAPPPRTGLELLVQIVPDNPLRAAAGGEMLAVMSFALVFGIGVSLTRTHGARTLERAIEGLYDVTMRLIDAVIALAPWGVAALLCSLTARLGYEVLGQLARYVGVVLLGLVIHQFVVYSIAVRLFGGMSPLRFFRGIQDAMITAFSTASSNATLPTALEVADEQLGLPRHVSRFVLTIGSTANQNGTPLFEGVTVLFLAQFYGIELSLAKHALVVLVCVLGGIGLVLGVDRFLDMCRTTLNVSGDLAAAVVVSRGEYGRPATDAYS